MAQKCERFTEPRISGYLDGVLDPSDRRWVELHLRQCTACRRLLEDLREIRTAMMTTRWQNFPIDRVARSF